MVRRDRVLLMAAAGLAVVAATYLWLQGEPAAATVPAGPPAAARGGRGELPRIGLDRLAQRSGPVVVGRRDIFDFGSAPAPVVSEEERARPPATPPPVALLTPPPSVGPPPPPPVNVKYIGSVEARRGPKVAFFLTEQKEVLTGQVGDTVMNRFKIVRIGIESVDVQDLLGSGQVRRLPLRGN